jgi:hypothetical protein
MARLSTVSTIDSTPAGIFVDTDTDSDSDPEGSSIRPQNLTHPHRLPEVKPSQQGPSNVSFL